MVRVSRRALWEAALDSELMPSRVNNTGVSVSGHLLKYKGWESFLRRGCSLLGNGLGSTRGILVEEMGLRVTSRTRAKPNRISVLGLPG